MPPTRAAGHPLARFAVLDVRSYCRVMDTTGEVLILFWLTVAVVGVAGVGSGLVAYHLGLGWFISRCSKETLEAAVGRAEVHCRRRAVRQQERARRGRLLAEAKGRPVGRHLAR